MNANKIKLLMQTQWAEGYVSMLISVWLHDTDYVLKCLLDIGIVSHSTTSSGSVFHVQYQPLSGCNLPLKSPLTFLPVTSNLSPRIFGTPTGGRDWITTLCKLLVIYFHQITPQPCSFQGDMTKKQYFLSNTCLLSWTMEDSYKMEGQVIY